MRAIHDVLSAYADAWRRGDAPALISLYDDDFTLHYPGRHALAGVHRGKDSALRVLAEVNWRTNRTLLDVIDVMAGARRGALNVRERWRRDNEEAVIERVFVYTVCNGKLDQCWLFDADLSVVERFLRA